MTRYYTSEQLAERQNFALDIFWQLSSGRDPSDYKNMVIPRLQDGSLNTGEELRAIIMETVEIRRPKNLIDLELNIITHAVGHSDLVDWQSIVDHLKLSFPVKERN